MANRNEQVIRDAVAALTGGDMAALPGFFAEDVVVHVPGNNQLSGDYKGVEEFFSGFLGKVMSLTGGEFVLEPHDILGSDDHAVGIYNIRAGRDGKSFEWRHVNVYHLRDGKITEVFQNPYEFEAWNSFWS